MNTKAAKAIKELKAIGAPVYHEGQGYSGNALFAISAEENDSTIWADYYAMADGDELGLGLDFGVNKRITKILEKHGLWAEWVNPGVLDVYKDF